MHNEIRSLKRRVLFYQIFANEAPVTSARMFDFNATFRSIFEKPNTLGGRRERESDESSLTCFYDDTNSIRFARVRTRNLPSRIDGETVSDIPLAPGGGLLEVTHLVYFEHGIIGAEFNFYAPRISRLGEYIHSISGLEGISVQAIVKNDAIADLRELRSIQKLTLQAATEPYEKKKQRQLPILDEIARASSVPGIETFAITLSAESGRNSPGFIQLLAAEIFGLASSPNLDEIATKFTVSGYSEDSNRLSTVDLLNDELVGNEDFIRENTESKTLDSAEAYKTITKVYRNLNPRHYIEE